MMDYIHLAPAVEGGKEGGGASATADPVLFTSSPYSPPPFFFDVVTPNLEPPRRTNRAARPRLAAHFAGRWQTIRHGCVAVVVVGDVKSAGQSRGCDQEGSCERIFKNNTLCCGDSFQAASSYYGCEW